MSSSLESNKTLAIIGSILMVLGTIPYNGVAVLGIIGVVLLLIALKGFSNHYQDSTIFQSALMGLIFYVIAIIVYVIAIAGVVVSFATLSLAGIGLGLIIGVVGLIVGFVFFLLAAKKLRATFSTLADKTGEPAFKTAGTLIWIGALLSIIVVGLLLIIVAWIFVLIGFFSMKVPSQSYNQPQYGYTPPPPPTAAQPAASNTQYCPNCGAPVSAGATFCQNCGKQLT